ncbi:hypothetical protein [Haloferula sp.]|uniref:hypothetical protein n=1 Tax=Haloferula sp. TaxID=2497595 RepID=UPI003C71D42C
MKDSDQIIDDYLDGVLAGNDEAEFLKWLKERDSNMERFTEAVMFEQQTRAALHAMERPEKAIRVARPLKPLPRSADSPTSSIPAIPRRDWLGRVATWLGAFTIFEKKAHATGAGSASPIVTQTISTIIMSKTTVTVAILIVGGGAALLIHQGNKDTADRVEQLQSEVEALQSKVLIERSPPSASAAAVLINGRTVREILEDWRRLHEAGPENNAEARAYTVDLNGMNGASLKELLLEAELIGDLPTRLIFDILLRLAEKSPKDATIIGARLVSSAPEFNKGWAEYVGKAFGNWLAEDPAAADAWYLSAAELGELTPNSIPPDGSDRWALDRLLAGVRFKAMLDTDPDAAEAMIGEMKAEDVAISVSSLRDTALIDRFVSQLPPSEQLMATTTPVTILARDDFDGVIGWISSMKITPSARDTLFTQAMESALLEAKLDLDGIAKLTKSLPITDDGLPYMLIRAATVAGDNAGADRKWSEMADRTSWLRQNLTPEQAEASVGRYLGSLTIYDVEKGLNAYENEVARSGIRDPNLTAAFAEELSTGRNETSIREALKMIETMPKGAQRDNARKVIEENRR